MAFTLDAPATLPTTQETKFNVKAVAAGSRVKIPDGQVSKFRQEAEAAGVSATSKFRVPDWFRTLFAEQLAAGEEITFPATYGGAWGVGSASKKAFPAGEFTADLTAYKGRAFSAQFLLPDDADSLRTGQPIQMGVIVRDVRGVATPVFQFVSA